MTQPKILFTDLDGTLLNSQKTISEHLYQRILEMTAKGHKFVLASGRSLENMIALKNKLGLTQEGIYITAFNGAVIYDCFHDTLLAENRLRLETAQAIYSMAEECGLYCHTYTDTHILTPAHTKELDYYCINCKHPYYLTHNLSEYLSTGPYKMLVINLDNRALLENFRDKIMHTEFASALDSTFSSPTFLEFYSEKAGKGNGLRILCESLHIPIENAYACGDEENDISMIEAAGTGIAMQNAVDITKAAADYTTQADNDHDALAEVIERFIL